LSRSRAEAAPRARGAAPRGSGRHGGRDSDSDSEGWPKRADSESELRFAPRDLGQLENDSERPPATRRLTRPCLPSPPLPQRHCLQCAGWCAGACGGFGARRCGRAPASQISAEHAESSRSCEPKSPQSLGAIRHLGARRAAMPACRLGLGLSLPRVDRNYGPALSRPGRPSEAGRVLQVRAAASVDSGRSPLSTCRSTAGDLPLNMAVNMQANGAEPALTGSYALHDRLLLLCAQKTSLSQLLVCLFQMSTPVTIFFVDCNMWLHSCIRYSHDSTG
jgi:hypothetical protein